MNVEWMWDECWMDVGWMWHGCGINVVFHNQYCYYLNEKQISNHLQLCSVFNCHSSKNTMIKSLKIYLLIISCIVIPAIVRCANILLLTHTFRSFVKEITSIGDTLAARGHNVYIILPESSNLNSFDTMQNIKTLTFSVKENDVFMDSQEFVDVSYGFMFENDNNAVTSVVG